MAFHFHLKKRWIMTKTQNDKILIVEDDVIISEYILEMLQDAHFKNIKIAHTKEDAEYNMTHFKPHIILMDINLGGKNSGIELSKFKNNHATVIFITGQQDYALMSAALKTNPDAYLTKPIKKVDLLASISLAIYKKQSQTFQFKDGYDTISLEFSDIMYIMADGNYINIYTNVRKYTIRQSLNTISKLLPLDVFKQSHRSFLINSNKIERLTATSVIINSVEIPLSRTFAKHFK
ncbi:response regulator transcription factor [Bizionia algoritergicola]|uniref:Response regulator transcription factor n=2 Tax=Flavobacteriaceae TaxID=49546 RepID=A0A5D0QT86_9FLAO|nr:response regulator transcription factor [Bizionia algoritergicola]